MAYTKHTWTDGTESDPSKGTLINASKLDDIENELEYLDDQLSEVNQSLSSQGEEISELNQSLSSQGEEISELNQSLSDINSKILFTYTYVGTYTNGSIDDFTTLGSYLFSTINDAPAGTSGWLIVLGNGRNTNKELWFRWGTLNSNDHQFYIRTMISGTWSNWHQVTTTQ